MSLSAQQEWWNELVQIRQSEFDKNLALMAEQEVKRLAAERAVAEAKAQHDAQKQADFSALKVLVDKVYFAYTLQRADDIKVVATQVTADGSKELTQLSNWTQLLTDGASVESVVSAMRGSESSMYYGANATTSIDNAYQTLFGRAANTVEKMALSGADPLLIPGIIALGATGVDAETMALRMQFSQAVKSYYEETNIPLTYGMPAMKAKEQLLKLKSGQDAADLVNNATREMGDFLAEWGRVINKANNSATDIEPPKSAYFWTDNPNVGVAFYEPPSAGSKGKILFTFSEPVDWSAIDTNRDGHIQIFSELNMVLSNSRLLGDNPKIVTVRGVNTLLIEIGENASLPSERVMDMITFAGVSDYAGNIGGVTFGLDFTSGPVAAVENSGTGKLVGDSLTLRFGKNIDWAKVDANGDGVVSIGTFGSVGAELQYVIQGGTAIQTVGAVQVDSFSLNQITLDLNLPNINPVTGGSIMITGVVDVSGNSFSTVFNF